MRWLKTYFAIKMNLGKPISLLPLAEGMGMRAWGVPFDFDVVLRKMNSLREFIFRGAPESRLFRR